MKKSIFALAITGALALTAAQADTVLYGSIRYGLDIASNHSNGAAWENDVFYNRNVNGIYTRHLRTNAITATSAATSFPNVYNAYNWKDRRSRGLNMRDVGSRIGLKGGEELGNGVKVVYQLEWGFDGVEGYNYGSGFQNRIAMIGLATDFGTFALGRLENPFKDMLLVRSEADNFNGVATSASMAAAGEPFTVMGNLNTFDAQMLNRVGNAAAYISPNWGGFSFNVAAVMDEGGIDDDGNAYGLGKKKTLDFWTLNLMYAHESGFYVNAGYITGDVAEKRANAYGLQLGFDNEQWGVNAGIASGQAKGATNFGLGNIRSANFWSGIGSDGANYGGSGNDWWYNSQNSKHSTLGWDIGGHFSFGPDYASTVRMTFGQAKSDKKSNFSGFSGGAYNGGRDKETNKMTTWALGFEQKLSNRTRVWIEYENTSVRQKFDTTAYSQAGQYSTNYRGTYYSNNGIGFDHDNNYFRSKKYKDDKLNIGIRHDF